MSDTLSPSPLDQAKHQLVNQYPGGATTLAPLIGIKNPAVLSNKVNPRSESHHLTVDESVSLQAITQNYNLLKTTAATLGHVAIKLPSANLAAASDIELLDCWAKWQEDCGQTAATLRKALESGDIDQTELAEIRREVFEDIAREIELLQRLEAIAGE